MLVVVGGNGGPKAKRSWWWQSHRKRLTGLRVVISIAAVTAFIARLIWPWLKLDAISLGLLIVAIVPWVSGLFESLELPGGWKISFRDLQRAADEIPNVPTGVAAAGEEPSYLAIQGLDPGLALVGLRIEVEKRLQQLDPELGPRPLGARQMVRRLASTGAIPANLAGALDEIVMAGNAAAHGAEVPAPAQDFAFTEGPRILNWLDSLAADTGQNPQGN